MEAGQNRLRCGSTTTKNDMALVKVDLETAKLKIAVLEEKAMKSRGLTNAFKSKWEKSQEGLRSLLELGRDEGTSRSPPLL